MISFDESSPQPLTKRLKLAADDGLGPPRLSPAWKIYVTESLGPDGKVFGLQEIFFSARAVVEEDSKQSAASFTAASNGQGNPCYTFRMERRQGGPMSQFRGEERILLFRSDKAGAVAKIIYSSEAPDEDVTRESFASSSDAIPLLQEEGTPSLQPPSLTAHAKIHVLDVKSQYRGRDLGGLLFSEAITALKSTYCDDDDESDDAGKDQVESLQRRKKRIYDVKCSLDAEEDVTRHGKLVKFYEQLGCRVKPSGKVQYVNNNDHETYRKVPMQIDLHPSRVDSPSKQERSRLRRKKLSQLVSSKGSFLPVQLVGSSGKLLVRSHGKCRELKLDWLLYECPAGIQFISTHGHILVAKPNGDVSVLSLEDQDNDFSELDIDIDELKTWTYFVPCHASEQDRGQFNYKDLWVMRTHHGTFLTANSFDHALSCTRLPSFWQPNGDNLSLVCTSDTPPRRHHYRKSWKFQTYEYVMTMRSRFLNFSLGKATLFQALNWVHQFPANPFHSWSHGEDFGPSLRTLSFLMAETAREEGFPDWVQLVALFHELGEAVKVLDPETKEMADSLYDWTISSRSRIVGCKVPDRASFSEFRHLNTDEVDSRYNTDVGAYSPHCGLEKVFLMWSGCEYMYHLLRHNSCLPDEGLAMIRYFLLGDWHEHYEYSALTNEDDADVLPFVSEFDALRRRVRLKCMDCRDLSDDQCKLLWEGHYAKVTKLELTHLFSWVFMLRRKLTLMGSRPLIHVQDF
eukprot:CCRYP_004917-RA/>CCRYP_004917-RA protein AED:0.13 eAED:0.13 QI:242/0.5/0.33/1/0.5/0.66/3/0/740